MVQPFWYTFHHFFFLVLGLFLWSKYMFLETLFTIPFPLSTVHFTPSPDEWGFPRLLWSTYNKKSELQVMLRFVLSMEGRKQQGKALGTAGWEGEMEPGERGVGRENRRRGARRKWTLSSLVTKPFPGHHLCPNTFHQYCTHFSHRKMSMSTVLLGWM